MRVTLDHLTLRDAIAEHIYQRANNIVQAIAAEHALDEESRAA